jgi:hypothetical protein
MTTNRILLERKELISTSEFLSMTERNIVTPRTFIDLRLDSRDDTFNLCASNNIQLNSRQQVFSFVKNPVLVPHRPNFLEKNDRAMKARLAWKEITISGEKIWGPQNVQ